MEILGSYLGQLLERFDDNIIWLYLFAINALSWVILNGFKEPRWLAKIAARWLMPKGRSIIKVMLIALILGIIWAFLGGGDALYVGKLINTYGWSVAFYHIALKRIIEKLEKL